MTDLQKARLRQMLRESDALTDTVMLWLTASAWTPVIVLATHTIAAGCGIWFIKWVGW